MCLLISTVVTYVCTCARLMMSFFDVNAVALGQALCILLCFSGTIAYLTCQKSPSVYDTYEEIGNPWWLPNILGKGPHTLFSEGYKSVRTVPLSIHIV